MNSPHCKYNSLSQIKNNIQAEANAFQYGSFCVRLKNATMLPTEVQLSTKRMCEYFRQWSITADQESPIYSDVFDLIGL